MEEQKMTVEQALNIIDGVCADFSGNRSQHAVLMNAMQVLRMATLPKEDEGKAESDNKEEK